MPSVMPEKNSRNKGKTFLTKQRRWEPSPRMWLGLKLRPTPPAYQRKPMPTGQEGRSKEVGVVIDVGFRVVGTARGRGFDGVGLQLHLLFTPDDMAATADNRGAIRSNRGLEAALSSFNCSALIATRPFSVRMKRFVPVSGFVHRAALSRPVPDTTSPTTSSLFRVNPANVRILRSNRRRFANNFPGEQRGDCAMLHVTRRARSREAPYLTSRPSVSRPQTLRVSERASGGLASTLPEAEGEPP